MRSRCARVSSIHNTVLTSRVREMRRRRDIHPARVRKKRRKGYMDRRTNASACIHYIRRVMRPTFIGQLATPRRQSELFAGPSRSLVSLFQFGSGLLLAPLPTVPSLPVPPRPPAGLFRSLAFLGSGREIYKADQEFPASPGRAEKRIV